MHLKSYLAIKEGSGGNIMLVFNLPNLFGSCLVSLFFVIDYKPIMKTLVCSLGLDFATQC